MNLIVLVVIGVLDGEEAAMEIEISDLAGKGEVGAGRGDNADLAREAAIGPLSGKAHVHQRSRSDVFEDGGGLAVADTGVLVYGKVHRNGVDGVTQREFAVLGIDRDDLAVGVGGRRGHAYADVARKNIVPVVVELGIHVNALALFERKLGGLRAVVEDVGALVKIDGPMPAAENVHRHAVAHAIDAGNGPADERGGGKRHGRGIKNRIVAVSGQRAGGGGAIQNVSFGLRRRWWRSDSILLLTGRSLLTV